MLTSLIVVLGLTFGFLNGLNDSGSLAAAMICSGGVAPRKALLLVAAAQLAGALAVGVAVAHTMGRGIVDPAAITAPVIVAALAGAIVWNALTWYLGLPSSSSHALIGALAGAALLQSGPGAVYWRGLATALVALFVSPWIGFVVSFVLMRGLLFLLQGSAPRVGARLRNVQVLVAPLVAAGHGANDSQKVMGVVALGLLALGHTSSFSIPSWLRLAAAASLAAGTSVGGLRVLRTLGLRLYRMRPMHGFAAQGASALVVLGASLLGGPVSATQVISAGIAGAGSAQRFSQVRWGLIRNIVAAWLLTVPAAAGVAALIYWSLRHYHLM